MLSPLIVAPLLLAAVLILSGLAKLREPQAARDAFTSLRLPAALGRSAAPVVLPWAELALAAALVLLPGWPALLASILGLVLMAVYAGVIARALGFEHPVDCSCFGKLGTGRVTPRTLVRNLLLVAAAALAVLDAARTDAAVVSRLVDADSRTWGWLAMCALTGLLAWLILDRGAEPAEPAVLSVVEADDDYIRLPIPHGVLERPDGTSIPLRHFARERARVLLFLNESCGPCVRAQRLLAPFAAENPEIGAHGIYREWANRDIVPADVEWLIDKHGEIASALNVHGTPGGILLGADGLVAGGPVYGEEAISEFLQEISEELSQQRTIA